MKRTLLVAALALAAAMTTAGPAFAQVAGSTTAVVTTTEASQVAFGWSVRKSILGKTVYNDAGQKIGKVEDLIIAPDKNVSYVIVGAGGYLGIGRHDVAVPVGMIRHLGGRVVLPGATKESVSAMPKFAYADDNARRERFVSRAEQDISGAKERLSELQKKAGTTSNEVKAKLDVQISALDQDVKFAEGKLEEMNRAGARHWKEFEASVSAATARLRKSIEAAAA